MKLFGYDAEIQIFDASLEFLRPIFEQWLKINRDYIEQNKHEKNLNWHNERANLSAFAGAVWRCGGVATEEFSAPKGRDAEFGRIDLQFSYVGKDILVEAKQTWAFLPVAKLNKDYWGKVIKPSLDDAIIDAKHTKLANEEVDFILAVTFVVPYWDAKKSTSTSPITMNELRKQLLLLNRENCAFCVYFEKPTMQFSQNSQEAFNSVILIGELV